MWSQTKRFVTLAIKLRGVEDKITNIGEKTFYFRYEAITVFFAIA